MTQQHVGPLSKKLTIVVGLTVVGFMAFGLALSFYRNALFESTLDTLRDENQKLRNHITYSQQDVEYYESAQYKDKYAKENLNQLNTGERVLIITERKQPIVATAGEVFTPTEKQEVEFEELLRQMPIIEHWKLFLFHKDEIDKIKKSL